ncbi:MAG: polyhydroxyalkanoate synthesis repressor PhaR [Rhodospirillales bacterium]|nr:polyhydroxyalkanoate synthesis repressor PhaR [Rhodospirillales bacterium]
MSETVKPSTQPVIVKKYANRRLYNTESSSYITLDNLAEMVRNNRDFVVYDAKSGDDITRSVLTQIIVEEEGKGNALLPTNFLRQLIGVYGTDMPGLMPKYLDQAMANFLRQQETMRETVSKTLGPFMPPGMEDMGRKNMEMMERALNLFTPFYREGAEGRAGQHSLQDYQEEILALRAEVERLHAELAAAKSKGKA